MKEAAVQNSAARSAAVNSPLNDSGHVDALLSQRDQPRLSKGASERGIICSKLLLVARPGSTGTGTVMDCKPASWFFGGTAEKSSLSSPLM